MTAMPAWDRTWSCKNNTAAATALRAACGRINKLITHTGRIKIDGKISVLVPGEILYTEGRRRYGCVWQGSGERV